MKSVIQRVARASVEVEGKVIAKIGRGALVLVGIEKGDSEKEASWMAEKVANLRIFEDSAGKMNLSVHDVQGQILAVSQFTLAGNCTKGRRPSFDSAAPPALANYLYEYFMEEMKRMKVKVEAGIFQADMKVSLVNNGPVTFILHSPEKGSR